MHYIGFDIGASSIKAALVKDKEIIKTDLQLLPPDLAGLLDLFDVMFKELKEGVAEIGGIGFGFAGMLDGQREVILVSPNIGYLDGQPLKKILTEKFPSYPVKIEHDAHCFLLAEKETGLAKDLADVFYLTLGSGVGGALMLDGKISIGAHGAAGEVAHTIINIDKLTELESLASNKFIVSQLGVGSTEAGKSALAGDIKSQETLKQLGRNLGVGVANIINIFDPEAIIINGGISEAQELILPGVQEGVGKFVASPAAKETKILFSQLGRFGGALGASLLTQKTKAENEK